MEEIIRTELGKRISIWLRHKPDQAEITLSPDGWASVTSILAAFEKMDTPLSELDIREIVKMDPKNRFELEGDRIRARYGHSVKLENTPHPGKPPAELFYGASPKHVTAIIRDGLQPIKRQYLLLFPDKSTARENGKRRELEPAIIKISAHDAFEAGINFYPRGKGIWLSDPIPSNFLEVLQNSGYPSGNSGKKSTAPGVLTRRRKRPGASFFKRSLDQ